METSKRSTQLHPGRLQGLSRVGMLADVLCTAYAGHAEAAPAAGTMTVTATVASTCIVSTSTLAFGSASSAAIQAGNIDATGTVSVNCTTGSAYTVALDKGAGTSATLPIRKMTSTPNTLNYTVYTDAIRTTVWGDGTASSTVAGTGTGAAQSISAYGRIFSGQTVPAAAYTDTINVTVTYLKKLCHAHTYPHLQTRFVTTLRAHCACTWRGPGRIYPVDPGTGQPV